jgi:transcriptional regulator with XRE-family HTH domain
VDIGDGRQNAAVSIGEVLAGARHSRGLTVAEVSHYTRVRESIIRAIERDDYLLSGSDTHARGDIRAIAVALGVNPDPLVAEFDEVYASVPEDALKPTIPFGRSERDGVFGRVGRRRLRWLPVIAVLVLVLAAAGFAVYHFAVVPGHPPAAAVSGRAGPGASRLAPSVSPAAAAIPPVSVTAFGPAGAADGDNPQLARLAIDRDPASGWVTGRYGTALFGGTRPGTGLLVDLGKVVRIGTAAVILGPGGADFQMLAGDVPSRPALRVVAMGVDAGGALGVELRAPVDARYVLIWFTKLPPDSSGTFQARVDSISVQGSGP